MKRQLLFSDSRMAVFLTIIAVTLGIGGVIMAALMMGMRGSDVPCG